MRVSTLFKDEPRGYATEREATERDTQPTLRSLELWTLEPARYAAAGVPVGSLLAARAEWANWICLGDTFELGRRETVFNRSSR